MKTKLLAMFVLASAAALVSCDRAEAQGYYPFGGFGNYAFAQRELANNVPYFSAFPPVYYSYPVPRRYGFSPYAYVPYPETPTYRYVYRSRAVRPQVIHNPYVEQSAQISLQPSSGQVQPLVILNPYVEQPFEVANLKTP